MISSISAWHGSQEASRVASKQRSAEDGSFSLMDVLGTDETGGAAGTLSALPTSLGADNNVKATIVVGELANIDASSARAAMEKASGGRPVVSGGSAGEDDQETMEVIYNTVVLPDGSKLVQVITKYPDGSTRCSTTHMPGTAGDESGFSRELTKAVNFAADLGHDEYVSSNAPDTSDSSSDIKKTASVTM